MCWKSEVDGIEERRRRAAELGGAEAVAAQRDRDRLTVRERINRLLDAESFREQGPIAGHSETDENGALRSFAPANYVLGLGRVDGRPCVIGGEDFTRFLDHYVLRVLDALGIHEPGEPGLRWQG